MPGEKLPGFFMERIPFAVSSIVLGNLVSLFENNPLLNCRVFVFIAWGLIKCKGIFSFVKNPSSIIFNLSKLNSKERDLLNFTLNFPL